MARSCPHDAFQLRLPGLGPPHCHRCRRVLESSSSIRERQPLTERARLLAQRYAELNPGAFAVLSAAAVLAAPPTLP
jgi:hypothetical protein